MINKYRIIMLLAILVTNQLKAQDRTRHEFSLGYGNLTSQLFSNLGTSLNILTGSKELTRSYSLGQVLLSYRYVFNDRVAMGLNVGYELFKGKTDNNYDWKRKDIKVALETGVFYKTFSSFDLYGLAGAGVDYNIEKLENKTPGWSYNKLRQAGSIFIWQLSPLCIRKGRKIGFYAELGYGYKGIVSGGLSLKL